MYNVTEASEMTGLRRNKLLEYIRAGKVEPTLFSLTGKHKFDDEGIEKIKKLLEEERKLVRSTEAAKILGIALSTVSNYIKRGIITPIKVVNGINYFDKEELEKISLSFGSVDFDNLIQTGEAAKILGISITWLNQLVKDNKLKPDRLLPCGKQYYLIAKIEQVAELAKQLEKEKKDGRNK